MLGLLFEIELLNVVNSSTRYNFVRQAQKGLNAPSECQNVTHPFP